MPGERDAENLRVALMSYDDRELRIGSFIWKSRAPSSDAPASRAGSLSCRRCGRSGALMCWC